MKHVNKKQGGFTLLELLVVVAILAIIAGAVISAISGQEERAGQGVALNTMASLENATQQHVVINRGLPFDLDALVCADLDGLNEGDASTTLAGGGALMPTLAPGLLAKTTLVQLPASGDGCDNDIAGACALTETGIVSLRYAEEDACDNDEATTATVDGNVVGDEEAIELAANRLFLNSAFEGGAGLSLVIDNAATVPVAILSDPTEVGQPIENVIGIFGVGDQSSFVEAPDNGSKLLARGPIDGNVEGNGERYSHFSLAIKLGEVTEGVAPSQAEIDTSAAWELEEVGIVAVLDSDGDYYGDEVAEFAGLEDE